MAKWQITLVTIFCEAVQDEVTVTVHNDWSVKCTGQVKYGRTNGAGGGLTGNEGSSARRQIGCEGSGCSRMTQYRDKLQGEEGARVETVLPTGKDGEQDVGARRTGGS